MKAHRQIRALSAWIAASSPTMTDEPSPAAAGRPAVVRGRRLIGVTRG
jgi:hypothetical protein